MTEPQRSNAPPNAPRSPPSPFEDLVPQAIAERAEHLGAEKARLDFWSLATLSVLAGAFIGLGAMFATTVLAGGDNAMPYGIARLVAGVVFSLGLILVVIGGAELFTGNNLMVMAWASRKVRSRELLRAWSIVYFGNLVGAVGTAALVFLSQQHLFGGGAIGAAALRAAEAKAALAPMPAFFLGVICNVLVCLAVWLCLGARTIADKILAIVPPVAAFVAGGFEHSIANMYYVPVGLFIKSWAGPAFWSAIAASPADFPALTIAGFVRNLVPVTLGNLFGGVVLVGAVYWFAYLRKR